MALLQQDMDDPACLEAYGEACLDLGQVDDALKIYLRLVTQKSEDKGIRRLLARALMADGGLAELRTHLPHVRGSAAALAFLATIVKDHSGQDGHPLPCRAPPQMSVRITQASSPRQRIRSLHPRIRSPRQRI